ncbi:unnamed protein product [Nyctereutes procyonoides]|uniref:(raccoon dog) hypothetical protein n=1 Tax=Nyctereutes procyonoides TaxID=34880 RepID=A0A811YTE4_NYCPR|nr:unnamed protein product [Nyctereutes procyonoides]
MERQTRTHTIYGAIDHLHLRQTTEQHTWQCQLYPRQCQQQQVPAVSFQPELRQAFLAETTTGGKAGLEHPGS